MVYVGEIFLTKKKQQQHAKYKYLSSVTLFGPRGNLPNEPE